MEPVRNVSSNPSEGFEFDFDWAANSKKVQKGTSLQFKPPCLTACAPAPALSSILLCTVPDQAHAACLFPDDRQSVLSLRCGHTCPRCADHGCKFPCAPTPCSSCSLIWHHLIWPSLILRHVCSASSSCPERCLLRRFTTGKDGVILYIYAVPTSANTTRTVINAASLMDRDAGKTRGFGALLKYMPRWARAPHAMFCGLHHPSVPARGPLCRRWFIAGVRAAVQGQLSANLCEPLCTLCRLAVSRSVGPVTPVPVPQGADGGCAQMVLPPHPQRRQRRGPGVHAPPVGVAQSG